MNSVCYFINFDDVVDATFTRHSRGIQSIYNRHFMVFNGISRMHNVECYIRIL